MLQPRSEDPALNAVLFPLAYEFLSNRLFFRVPGRAIRSGLGFQLAASGGGSGKASQSRLEATI
jgi:hypothetical protein